MLREQTLENLRFCCPPGMQLSFHVFCDDVFGSTPNHHVMVLVSGPPATYNYTANGTNGTNGVNGRDAVAAAAAAAAREAARPKILLEGEGWYVGEAFKDAHAKSAKEMLLHVRGHHASPGSFNGTATPRCVGLGLGLGCAAAAAAAAAAKVAPPPDPNMNLPNGRHTMSVAAEELSNVAWFLTAHMETLDVQVVEASDAQATEMATKWYVLPKNMGKIGDRKYGEARMQLRGGKGPEGL